MTLFTPPSRAFSNLSLPQMHPPVARLIIHAACLIWVVFASMAISSCQRKTTQTTPGNSSSEVFPTDDTLIVQEVTPPIDPPDLATTVAEPPIANDAGDSTPAANPSPEPTEAETEPKPAGPQDKSDKAAVASPSTDSPKANSAIPSTGTTGTTGATKPRAASSSGGPNIPGANVRDAGPAPPDPYGKFTALDNTFGGSIDWTKVLNQINQNIDSTEYTDLNFIVPLLTGVRICDGVMAVKARESEILKECADDIEDFARRLGVKEEDLVFAERIRDMALQGDWLGVYTNLSLLQNRVQKTMSAASPLTSTLVMVGGWMQGARYVSTGISSLGETASGPIHPTYFLREPRMVEWLVNQLQSHGPQSKTHAEQTAALVTELSAIQRLVDIDIDSKKGRLSPQELRQLKSLADGIVNRGLGGGQSPSPSPAPPR